jgi:HD-GYP domain-containing protein (c-di-GMP phosphodiesterase class II)
MRNAGPFARAGRAAHRAAAGRRLRECAPADGVPAGSPDRLCHQLYERIPRMARHHRAVADLAGMLARQIGLHDKALHAVVRAAELHDVGKVLVPEAILNKPGALSADELALMRRHAIAGYLILHESAEPAPVAALVRSSHERWDGTGYPDGLSREAIPLGARIITICDAYDAMTHERPYRPARSDAEALDELRLGAGVKYDPTLVAVFAATVGASAYRATRATQ